VPLLRNFSRFIGIKAAPVLSEIVFRIWRMNANTSTLNKQLLTSDKGWSNLGVGRGGTTRRKNAACYGMILRASSRALFWKRWCTPLGSITFLECMSEGVKVWGGGGFKALCVNCVCPQITSERNNWFLWRFWRASCHSNSPHFRCLFSGFLIRVKVPWSWRQ
jgi:hypothetical protein